MDVFPKPINPEDAKLLALDIREKQVSPRMKKVISLMSDDEIARCHICIHKNRKFVKGWAERIKADTSTVVTVEEILEVFYDDSHRSELSSLWTDVEEVIDDKITGVLPRLQESPTVPELQGDEEGTSGRKEETMRKLREDDKRKGEDDEGA